MALSGPIRASPQGWDFQVSYSLILQSPVSGMCGIFSNTALPTNSGRQARAMATACIAWRVSWTLLTYSSKGGLPYPVLFFFFLLDSI